jgi:alpha-tubulin suppressor-like RCC1 family protein
MNLIAFGDNDYGQAEPPAAARQGVLQVEGGIYHAIALMADGSVISWGDDQLGQLSGQPSAQVVRAGGGAKAVAAGGSHSLLLLNNGTVLAWGEDNMQQSQVPDAAKKDIVAIAGELPTCTELGWSSKAAIGRLPTESCAVFCAALFAQLAPVIPWRSQGRAASLVSVHPAQRSRRDCRHPGLLRSTASKPYSPPANYTLAGTAGWSLAQESKVPADIANRTDIIAISARTRVNMALTRNGSILMWGSVIGAREGVLMDFRALMPEEAEPAKAIAAGSTHFLAVGQNGQASARPTTS